MAACVLVSEWLTWSAGLQHEGVHAGTDFPALATLVLVVVVDSKRG